MNRRAFAKTAAGLLAPLAIPAVAYSFVGGWALPRAFVQERGTGRIIELVEDGVECHPFGYGDPSYVSPESRFVAHEVGSRFVDHKCFRPVGCDHVEIERIVVEGVEAWYDERGIVMHTTLPPNAPTPIVILKGVSA